VLRDPGKTVLDLAVTVALGGGRLADVSGLRAEPAPARPGLGSWRTWNCGTAAGPGTTFTNLEYRERELPSHQNR
jgi:hypothetical protein